MPLVRFATIQSLLGAFPDVAGRIGPAPADQSPIDFLMHLEAGGKLDEAATICAYLLPRREAVWWACGCVRTLLGEISADRGAGLLAAEAWVQYPNEDNRKVALEIGRKGDKNDPPTWLALAAGWSSGSLLAPPNVRAPVPSDMTARTARLAVLLGGLSALKRGKAEHEKGLRSCIAEGVKLAKAGLG